VFRAVERRYFDVSLVRGSTEGWSLSDKLKDMEHKLKEKDSLIELLNAQLTLAQVVCMMTLETYEYEDTYIGV
jgi:hypothetical protein